MGVSRSEVTEWEGRRIHDVTRKLASHGVILSPSVVGFYLFDAAVLNVRLDMTVTVRLVDGLETCGETH